MAAEDDNMARDHTGEDAIAALTTIRQPIAGTSAMEVANVEEAPLAPREQAMRESEAGFRSRGEGDWDALPERQSVVRSGAGSHRPTRRS